MHLIVGLGNPTKQYEGTRHNVGFETIDRIAAENQIRVEEKKHKALYGNGYIEGEKVIYESQWGKCQRIGRLLQDPFGEYHCYL